MSNRVHTTGKYNKLAAVIIVGTILGLLLFHNNSCDRWQCINVTGSNLWKEQEVYEHTRWVYRALLTAPSYRVRIEKRSKLSPSDASLLLKVRTMQVTGLFDDARSPYPGIISDRIRCDNAWKPTMETLIHDGLEITFLKAYLNNRLQYGTCVDSELVYKSYSASFYCTGENALYQLEFITDRKDADDEAYRAVIGSIRCLTPGLPLFHKGQSQETP